MIHVSEFGPISAKSPQVAKVIKTGSFPSVPQSGKIWVESTPMGTSGEFFDLVKAGEQLQASGQRLTPLDFKLHFFGWFMDPDNRLPINLVFVPADMREYFAELRSKHGIKLGWLATSLVHENAGIPRSGRYQERASVDAGRVLLCQPRGCLFQD